jgi:hypothetical protein
LLAYEQRPEALTETVQRKPVLIDGNCKAVLVSIAAAPACLKM